MTYFCPSTYISQIRSKHTLLISDSCFSGAFLPVYRSGKSLFDVMHKVPSRWLLASGRYQDVVLDGNFRENSPFSRALIDCLLNNRSKHLSVGEVFDYVSNRIEINTEQVPIFGPLINTGHKGGQFFLTKNDLFDKENLQTREELDWQSILAKSDQDKDIFTEFLRKYPIGKYFNDAKGKLLEIERDNFTFGLCRKTDEFREYLRLYPKGQNYESAKSKLDINIHTVIAACFNGLSNANYSKVYNQLLKELIGLKDGKKYRNAVVLFTGRWKSLQQKQIFGTINPQDYSVLLNEINLGLMNFLQGIEEE